jgi:hypothetical protein
MQKLACVTCFYSIFLAFTVGCQSNRDTSISQNSTDAQTRPISTTESAETMPATGDPEPVENPGDVAPSEPAQQPSEAIQEPAPEAQTESESSASNDETEVAVDLTKYTKAVNEYVEDSIKRFAKDHPDEQVSCIALYFGNYGSYVLINFETSSHSDAWVEKHRETEDFKYFVGKDEAGWFNNQPTAFAYGQHDEYAYDKLPDFYEVEWPIKVRSLDGKVKKVDSYDQSVGQVLMESFVPALKSFEKFDGLKRAETFRMGISIHNTSCEEFWIHKQE